VPWRGFEWILGEMGRRLGDSHNNGVVEREKMEKERDLVK